MANPKNNDRRKRKYGESRKATTEKNHKSRLLSEERRQARLTARTQSLIGQHAAIRVKDHAKPLVGTVLEVVGKDHDEYPHRARRHVGKYLKVRTTIGDLLASRHRVKPIKDK